MDDPDGSRTGPAVEVEDVLVIARKVAQRVGEVLTLQLEQASGVQWQEVPTADMVVLLYRQRPSASSS